MNWKVITDNVPNEVWASGFADKAKAQKMVDDGYWHRFMYAADKHKKLIVVQQEKKS